MASRPGWIAEHGKGAEAPREPRPVSCYHYPHCREEEDFGTEATGSRPHRPVVEESEAKPGGLYGHQSLHVEPLRCS